ATMGNANGESTLDSSASQQHMQVAHFR
ncbi:hypothetical protein WJX84_010291, partial [Apatococcus fuscideae]